jgi:hypothetical protein
MVGAPRRSRSPACRRSRPRPRFCPRALDAPPWAEVVSDLDSAVEPEAARVERHASWAELFFDLVAVAGVSALADVLGSGLDGAAVGLYALLFLAFWLSWTTFMLYSNVAAGQTRVVRLMIGMFGLGVMAAALVILAHLWFEQRLAPAQASAAPEHGKASP